MRTTNTTKYYFCEVQWNGNYQKAQALKAQTMTAAKREASRKACFYNTILEIGTKINSQGFILDPIFRKWNTWEQLDY